MTTKSETQMSYWTSSCSHRTGKTFSMNELYQNTGHTGRHLI